MTLMMMCVCVLMYCTHTKHTHTYTLQHKYRVSVCASYLYPLTLYLFLGSIRSLTVLSLKISRLPTLSFNVFLYPPDSLLKYPSNSHSPRISILSSISPLPPTHKVSINTFLPSLVRRDKQVYTSDWLFLYRSDVCYISLQSLQGQYPVICELSNIMESCLNGLDFVWFRILRAMLQGLWL